MKLELKPCSSQVQFPPKALFSARVWEVVGFVAHSQGNELKATVLPLQKKGISMYILHGQTFLLLIFFNLSVLILKHQYTPV